MRPHTKDIAIGSSRKLRVAIVGYGVAGISAALHLRRAGHHVTHFEQADEPACWGAGLLLQASGLEALRNLGLYEAAVSRGSWISRLHGVTQHGYPVMAVRYDELRPGLDGLGIQRGALFDLLRAADTHFRDLHTSHQIVGLDSERGVLFERHRGTIGPFDLIVGADGADSRMREGLASLVTRNRPYTWGALLCLLDDPDCRIGDAVRQIFAGARHVSLWPVGSVQPGAVRRVNLSWRVPISAQAQRLSSDVDAWKREISELCPDAAPLLRSVPNMRALLPTTYRDVELRRYFRQSHLRVVWRRNSCPAPLGGGTGF